MPTRVTFHAELRLLEDSLLAMADLVGAALERSSRGLLAQEYDESAAVIAGDEQVNDLHGQITRGTLELIATQQPLASDLREVLAIFGIATDLERIGDHAKGISKIALRLEVPPAVQSGVLLAELTDLVRGLLGDIVDAFVHRDPESARAVARRDDEVDLMYGLMYDQMIKGMQATPSAVGPGESLLWVAKSLERCGDHVTNIAEWVVFQATGDVVELNP